MNKRSKPMKSFPKWLAVLIVVVGGLLAIALVVKIQSQFGVKRLSITTQRAAMDDGYVAGVPGERIWNSKGEVAMDEEAVYAEPKIAPSPIPPIGGSAAQDLDGNEITPRIIRTGSVDLRVEDAPDAMARIQNTVSAHNGFVESSRISDSGEGARTGMLTLRIPVDRFHDTVSAIKELAIL
ncbi:DUF4349 domain-containing protein, partial [Candidatus Uhrbacteria bacterium]|nr:DUF4349 domain-containing protein [Candidatus Uhrbacteria bacterium]MBD3284156.1 DUF4349 domain-containing protein [Candidatus Uhrbacteria bacterium]